MKFFPSSIRVSHDSGPRMSQTGDLCLSLEGKIPRAKMTKVFFITKPSIQKTKRFSSIKQTAMGGSFSCLITALQCPNTTLSCIDNFANLIESVEKAKIFLDRRKTSLSADLKQLLEVVYISYPSMFINHPVWCVVEICTNDLS